MVEWARRFCIELKNESNTSSKTECRKVLLKHEQISKQKLYFDEFIECSSGCLRLRVYLQS